MTIISKKQYKDMTVSREKVIVCGADWRDHPDGEEIIRVAIIRQHCGFVEVMRPDDPLFIEAEKATRE